MTNDDIDRRGGSAGADAEPPTAAASAGAPSTATSAPEWWRGAVIYQIYPRSFADSNGDGVGDLAASPNGSTTSPALGVDGIWLSPFFVSPMKDFGYDVADYCDVDPLFGTLADFDALLARAHALGLKVIIDQVYSHTSDQHPWFPESRQSRDNPKADWYVWADPKPDGTPPNNWLSVFGGAGVDLGFAPPPVLSAQLPAGAAGSQPAPARTCRRRCCGSAVLAGSRRRRLPHRCRQPVLPRPAPAPTIRRSRGRSPTGPTGMQRPLYNRGRPETLAVVARLRALLDRYPERMAVAELASSEDPIGDDDRVHRRARPLPHRLQLRVDGRGVRRRRWCGTRSKTMMPRSATAWPSWAFSNHDVVRAPSPLGSSGRRRRDRAGVREAADRAALLPARARSSSTRARNWGCRRRTCRSSGWSTRKASPSGRAIAAATARGRRCRGGRTRRNAGFCPDGVEPWLPVDPRHLPLAVARQEADPGSVLAFTRRFLAWRKRHPALIRGSIRFLDVAEPLLAFERAAGAERLLCVFNLGGEKRHVPLEAAKATVLAPSEAVGSVIDDGFVLPAWGSLFATSRN